MLVTRYVTASELPKNGSAKTPKRIRREKFWPHEERAVG